MDEDGAKQLVQKIAAILEIEQEHREQVVQDLANLIVRQAGLLALKQLLEGERQELAEIYEKKDENAVIAKTQALTAKFDMKQLTQQAAQDVMRTYFEAITANITDEHPTS